MSEANLSGAIPDQMAEALQDLTIWLTAEKIPQAIIGGIAVALVAQARATQDVDAVIWLDLGQIEKFILSGAGYGFIPRLSDAADFARANRVLLLRHQSTGIAIDLSCGALPFESEVIERATTVIVGQTSVRVATPEDLVILKAVARRPRDLADIESIADIHPHMDLARIDHWVREFAEVLETPEMVEDLNRILRR